PRLVDDAERAVTVFDPFSDHAQRDEVVDLFEIDLLALELLMDAPEALDASVDLDDGNQRFGELRGDGGLELLDQPFGRAAPGIAAGAQRLERLWLEIAERQLLELVLHLAHPEAIGDWRVDVARLLGDFDLPLLG